MQSAWIELFNFCRETDGTGKKQNLQLTPVPDDLAPVPELRPAHHAFFTTDPVGAADWVGKYTNSSIISPGQQKHRYSDGRCALLKWARLASGQFSGSSYDVHFVDQFRKHDGTKANMTVSAIEEHLVELNGDMSEPNAYWNNRIGLAVEEIESTM